MDVKPQSFTNSDLLTEYWMIRLVKEQVKTNELLEKLVQSQPSLVTPVEEPKKSRLTRKKKEGE